MKAYAFFEGAVAMPERVTRLGIVGEAEERLLLLLPMLVSYHNIQVLLAFANFHYRLTENISNITKTMSDMLKGRMNEQLPGPFGAMFMIKCAFQRLQQALTTAPLLVHFDLHKHIWLETDSSSFAIAEILSIPVDQARPKAP